RTPPPMTVGGLAVWKDTLVNGTGRPVASTAPLTTTLYVAPGVKGARGVTKTSPPPSAATTVAASGPEGPLSVTVAAVVGSTRSGLEKRRATRLSVGTLMLPTRGTEAMSCGLSLGSGVVGRTVTRVNPF